jgi:hypothetical protein
MPFIRGRYHMNPIVGQALEAAREAEAARLAALEPGAHDDSGDGDDDFGEKNAANSEKGPIHRVEIEAAELVPSHSGRAHKGFVARVHREEISRGGAAAGAPGKSAETHVFSDHHDLVGFLRDEFAKDCAGK